MKVRFEMSDDLRAFQREAGITMPHYVDDEVGDYVNFVGTSTAGDDLWSYVDRSKQARVINDEPGCVECDDSWYDDLKVITSTRVWNTDYRLRARIGKVYRRIALSAPGWVEPSSADISRIVEMWAEWQAIRKNAAPEHMEYVRLKGEEIRQAYLYAQASEHGSIGASCMRYAKCQQYLDIYVDNPQVELAVIREKYSGTILARALVWAGKYSDRVYSSDLVSSSALIGKMRNDGLEDVYGNMTLKANVSVVLDNVEFDQYPYLDTFFYLNMETREVSNNRPPRDTEWRYCQSTEGHYEDSDGRSNARNGYECENCGRGVDEDDVCWVGSDAYCDECAVYSDYYHEYIVVDDAVWCAHGNYHLTSDDAVLCYDGEYCHHEHAVELSGHRVMGRTRPHYPYYAYGEDENIVEVDRSSGPSNYALRDDCVCVGDAHVLRDDAVLLHDGEYAHKLDVVELFDGEYALEWDENVVQLFTGEYAHTELHDVVVTNHSGWVLVEDTVTTYDGHVEACQHCVVLYCGGWAWHADPALINLGNGLYTLECDILIGARDVLEVKHAA